MKNKSIKIYLLTISALTLVLIDTPVDYKIRETLSDESRLRFHFLFNNQIDTTITLINMADYPMDSIQQWVRRIIKFKPRVLALDSFSDTLFNTERIDAEILLPIISQDQTNFEYSANNITTSQIYGVAVLDDYSRMTKYFLHNQEMLPSFAVQIFNTYTSNLNSRPTISDEKEIVNYLPTRSFRILDLPAIIPDDFLEPLIKDKIVIIGFLGYNTKHVPHFLDNNDSHKTPIGKLFGPIIIANQVRTLLGNRIAELNQLAIVLMALIALVGSYLAISKIIARRKFIVVVSLNLLLFLLLVMASFASMVMLDRYGTFISIELLAFALTFGFQIGIVSILIVD